MMAPAMNTLPDERLPYPEMARQGARVVRVVQADTLTRLADIAPGRGKLHVEMAFHADDQGRPWVTGSAEVVLGATCQRCLEQFDRDVRVDFELCIVRDPELASRLAGEVDVLMAETDTISVAEIVEDELLMGLPEQLCEETPCPYAPALEYPADGAADEMQESPFQVLSELKHR